MENMDETNRTFIVLDDDSIIARLERTPFKEIKKFALDVCKQSMDSDNIDTTTLQMVLENVPDKEPLRGESISLVYEAFKQYCDMLDKNSKSDKFALDAIQAAMYALALKVKILSDDSLEIRDQIWRLWREISDFKCLLHVVLEGIKSGSTGPDENENALSSLYAQFEQIADHGEEIKEEYFT